MNNGVKLGLLTAILLVTVLVAAAQINSVIVWFGRGRVAVSCLMLLFCMILIVLLTRRRRTR